MKESEKSLSGASNYLSIRVDDNFILEEEDKEDDRISL